MYRFIFNSLKNLTLYTIDLYSYFEILYNNYVQPFLSKYIYENYESNYEQFDYNDSILFFNFSKNDIIYTFISDSRNIDEEKLVILEKTNYFISVTINCGNDEVFEIKLNDDKRNFYIFDNCILFYEFVAWYMSTQYNKTIEETDKYLITIIDQNCKTIEITNDQYIILSGDSYEILNKNSEVKE